MISPASISVIIPLYNKQQYISNAIRSALEQGPLLREIIVVDDGSTDAGVDIVRDMKDPRIRLVSQKNGGVSKARNTGITAASGDYVAFLDADDWYVPGFLQAIATLIAEYPSAAMFGTAYRLSREAPRLDTGYTEKCIRDNSGLVCDFFAKWKQGPFFSTSSVCIRRSIFSADSIAFPLGENLGEDQDVWFRIAERYPVAFCDLPLAVYRVDVVDSLTFSRPVLHVLPVFSRLYQRAHAGPYPPVLRQSAFALVSRQCINVSRSRLYHGNRVGALQILFQRECKCRPAYWWVSLLACFIPLNVLRWARDRKQSILGRH